MKKFFLILLVAILSFGCSKKDDRKVELFVSAAASLTDALQEVQLAFENEHPGVTLIFTFGSSGKLAQQILNGAPSDVFLSASEKDMNTLEQKGELVDQSRIDFTGNQLVLITNKDDTIELNSFEKIRVEDIEHLAIGEPESVPVGRYTKEMLTKLQLWDSLQGKMVFGSDVRQVLTYVESGNVDLGFVYLSDALISDNVRVVAKADESWHEPIVYPGAIMKESKHIDESKAFLQFLTSEKGKEILQKYGFK